MNTHRLLAVAALCSSLLCLPALAASPVSPTALQGKKVLFVVGEGKKGVVNDDPLIKRYLEARGVTVTMAGVADAAGAAQGKDLVIISDTADARELGDRYRNVTVPVVTWNAYSFADMDMTGKVLHQDFSVVREHQFHNANHAAYYAYATSTTKPIIAAAGIPHGIFSPFTFSAGETDMSWGKPSYGADVSVTFEGTDDKAAVFSYEKGSLMYNDVPAPARRVGLFLSQNSFTVLTDANGPAAVDPKSNAWFAGRRVFDAALRWAVSPPEAAARRPESAQVHADIARNMRGKKVLFVRRFDMPWPANEASDQAHMKWLRSLGVELTVVDQMEPDTHAQGKDLVILSASTNKYKIGNKYSDTNVPVVLLEAKAVDSMHMVSRRRNTDYGVNDHKASLYPPENYVTMLRPAHPLSAGFPAGRMKLYKTPGVLAWSVVPVGAEVIASIPNQPQHGTFFCYEKGAVMANDHVAPARRLLFPMDATRFPDLTDEGLQLYGRALMWASDERQADNLASR